ncbi:4'-phosphopantetheinyl transferase superfamily protein [Streptomyces sp. NPDC005571]|uniref:4'-phosphopantetheinyl transferase family protein n=1 Tax=Streptomyces sp. NPDC005571 TaxID=3156888 RepID=UPI0033BF29DE
MTILPIRSADELRPTHWDQSLRAPSDGDRPAVWFVRTGELLIAAQELAPQVLDVEERRRAAAFVRSADRDTYTVSHVALRMLLAAHLDEGPARISLDRGRCPSCGGPHGRPVVRGNPVNFSLSHTNDLAMIAIAATPVGIDIEAVPGLATVEEVGHTLHVAEHAELQTYRPEERREAFARIWVRKEAYFKGLGTGLSRGLAHDRIGAAPEGAFQPAGWMIEDIGVDTGYTAAVAAEAPAPE